MKKEEKEKFLEEFGEFINYLVSKEKADFTGVKKILGIEVNDLTIREARSRDIKRSLNPGNGIEPERKKEEHLNKLCMMCPEFFQLVKRLDQSYFSIERRDSALPEEMMTSQDWKLIYNFCKTVMK